MTRRLLRSNVSACGASFAAAGALSLLLVAACGERSPAPGAPDGSGGARSDGPSSVVGAAPAPVSENAGTAAEQERRAGGAVAAPGPAALPLLHFTDVTAESGLIASMTSGALPSTQILEVKGGGLALIDFDGDGDFDIFMPNGATLDDPESGPGARLFENLGGLRFRDVSERSGIDLRRWAFGVAVGDYDGDGRDDLYICCFGGDVLLRNLGDGRFEDVTAAAGIDAGGWSTSAAFADLDGDGDLDLYVTRYLGFDVANPPGPTIFKSIPVMAGPIGLPATVDLLFENLGDGTFREVGEPAGIRSVPASYGLNLAILDLDGDGRPDIYVANDSRPSFLFLNRTPAADEDPTGAVAGGGATRLRFEERGMASGIAVNIEGTEQASMGIGVADVDGDGRPDIFTTNFSSDTNTLHINGPGGVFSDRTQQYGLGAVSRPYLGWACGFFDFDLDGDEDLVVFNGHVYPQASRRTMDSDYQQVPLLFERSGRRFARVPAERGGAWLAAAHRDRTALFADLDGDGDIDIVVGELNGPLRVLRNDAIERLRDAAGEHGAATPGRWLIVELDDRGNPGNRRGVGSVISAAPAAPSGANDAGGAPAAPASPEAVQTRWIWGGGPFMSNAAPLAHFGFPEGSSAASEGVIVTVRWPDGGEQVVGPVSLGRRLVVVRAAAAG
ncbi:MAG TPA: CRTAC1 family protein [Phycisphaerales bacterium]|nr:CRTAC1 family protein [Phycisphaerales bacterium]HMP36979.1 CRTAC1 family protein [Phycisphaerales bacterium]